MNEKRFTMEILIKKTEDSVDQEDISTRNVHECHD